MDNLLHNLKAVLSTTPDRWHQITQNFSDDILRRQPLEDEWSALECLVHLIDLDRTVFPSRVKSFLAGENFAAFDPATMGTKLTDDVSATELAEQFATIRAENLQLIDTVTDDVLGNEANHSELGLVTLGQLLHEWGGHDLMHVVQAERALMQPFILGCGAWKPYFSDHSTTD